MSEPILEAVRLSPAELRTLFLFESLDDDQLDWLSENGYCKTWLAGQEVYTEGEPATCFFILLSRHAVHASPRGEHPRWKRHAPTNVASTRGPPSRSSKVWTSSLTGHRCAP